jgi:flagellar biosynthetic protein FlhB
MSETDKDQKTEAPTQKRLDEARAEGNFAKSSEIGAVMGLIGALAVVSFTLPTITETMRRFAQGIFSRVGQVSLEPATLYVEMANAGRALIMVLAPIFGAVVIMAVMSGGLQSGFRLSTKAVGFKPEKLDPTKGFGRVFSKRTVTMAMIDVLKLIAIGLMLWVAARQLLNDPLFSSPLEVAYLGEFISRTSTSLLSRLVLALGLVAALSYAYEWKRNVEDMKMSRQEIKDEHRQSEGDQMLKAAMKRMARRLMQKQMLEAVPTADVVITNPTHYAVALKYERGVDSAPIVLAKGENRLARRIKEMARQHEVPMVENRPVARMLYAVGKVGEPIPADLFGAVAEILAFVYKQHRYYFYRLKARRAEAARQSSSTVAQPGGNRS